MMRKIIYSALVGDYDAIPEHLCVREDWEYILFTDHKTDKEYVNGWKILPLQKVVEGDPSRTNRWHKLNPHLLFENCLCSIYLDCNIVIKTSFLYERADTLLNEKVAVSTMLHPFRDCIFEEAKVCIKHKRDSKSDILKTIQFLEEKKYPKRNGLFENNLFFRNHQSAKFVEFNELWWKCVSTLSKRDQLSMCYSLWELGIKCIPFSLKNHESVRNSEHFDFHEIHHPKKQVYKVLTEYDYGKLKEKEEKLTKIKKSISYKLFYKIEKVFIALFFQKND